MSTECGIYVFCTIEEKTPKKFGKVIVNGEETEIYTLHYENAAMVVSRVSGEVLPERQNLFAHQKVITEVMKSYTVIPMSFGNVFNSEEDVLLIMKHLYKELEVLFSQLANKIEVGLKVVAKQEWIEQEMKRDPILSEWKNSNKDLTNPALFYDKIQLGEHAQKFVKLLEQKLENEIYHPLVGLSDAGKLNSIIPGKTILNAAFLVNRDNEEAFDERVNQLYEQWKDKTDFKYSGPWPAYNFVNIRLRIEK